MGPLANIRRAGTPAAFTLVELLVASTIALIVMGAVASLFGSFSRAGTNSQSVVDMSNRLRVAANRLRQDLAGLTAPLSPPLRPEANLGYFELIEGPWTDATDGAGNLISGTSSTSILGDADDAILFTTRSSAGPFEGNYNGNLIESTTAEVAWYCLPSTTQPVSGVRLQTLYRKQLLVVGYVGNNSFTTTGTVTNNQISTATYGTLPTAYNTFDISLRYDTSLGAGATNVLVPNTLGDLTRRENRFFHDIATGTSWQKTFPTNSTISNTTAGLVFDTASNREGEDIVLTNVIGFDVRVFDPDALPLLNGTTVVYPNEQTYVSTLPVAGFTGCFLDLGCGNATAATVLSGTGSAKSKLQKVGISGTATYDTWNAAYENNGVDDDSDGIIDEGTNGVDNSTPADGIPDDPGEAETAPPYSKSLQAIEIRIRCYDPTSREIRQVTVRQMFTN